MTRSPASVRNQRDPFKIGLVTLIVILIGCYFGFTKNNPFASPYQVKAAFKTVNALKEKAPVRIAGVTVGKVSAIETMPGGRGAIVTMEIKDGGLPLRADATFKVRPRIFLEGNYFVDVEPGSPEAPELVEGTVVPVQQTAAPVQLGQVLTALQSDTREDLRTILDEYGRALEGGADGFNRSIQYWEPAFKNSAIVNDATLGVLEHDLGDYVESTGKVSQALDRNPERLKSLITDFAATADALARAERPLTAAIRELPRTLQNGRRALGSLNEAFPPLRRLITDLRPAVRASAKALEPGVPFARQLRLLIGEEELGGLTKALDRVVPSLVELQEGGVDLQKQIRLVSACQNNVLLPWSGDTIEDPNFPANGPVYQDSIKWLPGISGESRAGDANGQWIRTLAQTANYAYPLNDGRLFFTTLPLQGVRPAKSARPPMRSDVDCETQEPPDLRAQEGVLPSAVKVDQKAAMQTERYAKALDAAVDWLKGQVKAEGLQKQLRVTARQLTLDEVPTLKAISDRARKAAAR